MAGGMFLIERYLGSEDENSSDSSGSLEDTCNKNYNERKIIEESNDKISDVKEKDIKEYQDNSCNKKEIKNHLDKKYSEDGISHKSKRKKQHTSSVDIADLESSNKPLNDNVSCAKSEIVNDLKSPNISLEKKKKRKKKALHKKNTLEAENKSVDVDGNFCTIGEVKDSNIKTIKPILPKWISEPSMIESNLQGHKIPVSEVSCLDSISKKNLQDYGIDSLFPVQSAVIPWLLQNNQQCQFIRPSDVCVSAPTGSGKTLAFVLPIVQSLRNRVVTAVRALVVLPVIELAVQVYKVFEIFVRNTDLQVILLTGQKSFVEEQKALVKSGIRRELSLVDIIVTTPGRILDHISRTEGFSLQHLRFLVIDEADRMMENIQKGWLKQIENAVYKNCNLQNCLCFATEGQRIPFPASTACHFGYTNEPLQKLLYSATLSHNPEKLHTLSLYKPKLFTTTAQSKEWIGKCSIPEKLSLYYIVCKEGTKPLMVCHFIKEHNFKKVLCFTKSVERAQRLYFILAEMGIFKVNEIYSKNTPVQRKIILENFNTGKIDLLICTDLVARGMDFEGVDCVFSYDTPCHIKNYVHQIGRTARAGKKGSAVSLITQNESKSFNKMIKDAGMPVPEHVSVNNKNLEIYIDPFKKALSIANSKVREMKNSEVKQQKRQEKSKRCFFTLLDRRSRIFHYAIKEPRSRQDSQFLVL
ncbi:ATP-dependent RNA helicase DDX51 [Trichonephila inaurata madagascariensis]|uniref:ATP-dependent RNA helicase n=1 Tax=Trichonephila inaurata madagascariensis TaxID=2747483 RepID=A0A8X6X5M8_9ARAC|nr:ATP-dependent RNA helicase DDX51 [Trichonephila inaurata madagascariensis]